MKIRDIEIKDAQKLLKMQSELDKETKNMLLEPEERNQDFKGIEKLITKSKENDDFFMIAEDGDEIVGFIMGKKGEYKRIQHRAYLVVGIRTGFQGKGVGSEFFITLDKWAKRNQMRRLELTVLTQNEVAIKLYKKNGFVIEGTKKTSMIIDGENKDEYYMGKLL